MTLYEKPDSCISFRGKTVRLRAEFYRVLQCSAIVTDPVLSDTDKVSLCLRLLVKSHSRIPKEYAGKLELFQAVFGFLSESDKRQEVNQKVFDFEQDAAYIYAAFYQCYHIDLHSKTGRNLHWRQFISLFSGLPENTRFMEIVSIRSRPMPKATKYNAEQRQSLAKLKALHRLELSEEERKAQLQQGLAKMAIALQTMADRP